MEKVGISGKYSTKCIAPPPFKKYSKKLITQTEKFIRNLSWKIIHTPGALERNEEDDNDEDEMFSEEFNTYGFKSEHKPPPVPEIENFIDDIWKIVRSVKQRPVKINSLKIW